MKIGIPSNSPGGLDAGVSAHFGHCDLFTAVEIEGSQIKTVWTIDNDGEHNCMIPVRKMADAGIDAVLIGGIGRRPLMEFQNNDIKVFIGAEGMVKDALANYLSDSLMEATVQDVCQGSKNCH
ncbi:MAG: NifB/NifX family molybdenum-iron cluster-binding protein [Methanomassiliicoccales archaeon]|jgi:predicted Fe-Mo cluster-binding NifX family protein